MNDPFEPLRGIELGDVDVPEVAAVRARAARIRHRRYAALGGTASLAVLAVAVAAVVRTGPGAVRTFPSGQAAPGVVTVEGDAAAASAGAPLAADGSADTAATSAAGEAAPPASEAQADRSGPTAVQGRGAVSARVPPADESSLTVEVVFPPKENDTFGPDEPVEFRLIVCNNGAVPVEATFNDSQRERIVVRRAGQETWRSDEDMAYAQVIGTERWEPGECRTFGQARWTGKVPGAYDVVGTLTSRKPQTSAPKRVCVVTCS